MTHPNGNGLAKNLIDFLRTARHLWGRCPSCATPFRLSDVAVSTSPEPPRDWLRRLERQQQQLLEREQAVGLREDDAEQKESELADMERDLNSRDRLLESNAHKRVHEILRSNTEVQGLVRQANKAAVLRSRATLLGKLFERLAPCFRKFAHDPRDMRCICDPVDYVLFDGLTADREIRQVTFIEVKSGRSRLTPTQRSLREALQKGVNTEIWEIGNPNIPITKQLDRRSLLPASQD